MTKQNQKYLYKLTAFGIVALFATILVSTSCTRPKDYIEQDFGLDFSMDTVTFDTVFTTIGTSTQYLVVRNTESSPIRINQIFLAGGDQSNFRINVDGLPGTVFKDVEIDAKDSLYIFIEVTVDPNNSNSPMVITDSIVFDKNGSVQDVDLVACGQDAYFILPDHFNIQGLPYNIVAGEGQDTIWDNTKPIVVYGYAVIDSAGSLSIEKGTHIHFHANSGLWSYIGGKLTVNGTIDEPVIFQDDRPESYYDDKPGQWDRIWLNESFEDHSISNAIIKNGFIGLQVENLVQSLGNKVILENVYIQNISGAGILSRNYNVDISNCVISNIQQYALTAQGGNYNIQHLSIGNYWSYSIRQNPSVYISNYYIDPYKVLYPFDLDFNCTNSIIYGNQSEELVIDTDALGGNYDYFFEHLLVKTEQTTTDSQHWASIFKNQDPLFEDYSENDLHLKDGSPAIEAGKAGVLTLDIEGNTRDTQKPDLGAYEFQ